MKLLGDKTIVLAPGEPTILGVTPMGRDLNCAVAVPGAFEVTLKLYNEDLQMPEFSILLEESDRYGAIFSVRLRNFSGKGYSYTYEVKGCSFVDPYTSLLLGRETYGKRLGRKERKLLRGRLITPPYSWQDDKRPQIPLQDSILYKLHVRGFSMTNGNRYKGTYRGITERTDYLKRLGVNGVLLMPVMEYNEMMEMGVEEGVPNFKTSQFYKGSTAENKEIPSIPSSPSQTVEPRTKVNYWGYTNHYFFFAPKASYAYNPGKADMEFKDMVKGLHKEGIEVLLEVNLPDHTNRSLILDCLRFWVREYHVDGFRLNLENTDACMLANDPYLSGTKLLGAGWEMSGRTEEPEGMAKNLATYTDGFAMDVRRFLKSDEGAAGAFARRITCNPENTGVINYITDHNGFTLADLYAYDIKHNEANGENGRDGSDYNYSWNCGTEGPDRRKKIRDLRLKMKKNGFLALLLAQGTPMLLSGDEFGNTQQGNNNAYCQDNEIGWLSWSAARSNVELQAFVREAIALRKSHPVLHNVRALRGMDPLGCGCPDVSYHSTKAWGPDEGPYNRTVGILLNGRYAKVNHTEDDDSFYLVFNMYWEDKSFDIPNLPGKETWKVVLASDKTLALGELKECTLLVPPRTIAVLQSVKAKELPKATRKKPVVAKK